MTRKTVAFGVFLAAAVVWAGEKFPFAADGVTPGTGPGVLVVSDGGTVNNWNTGGQQFALSASDKLTVQCPDAGAWVLTDVTSCSAGRCIYLPAGQALATSINSNKTATRIDGGSVTGGLVAIRPEGAAATCNVWLRTGTE